MRIRSRANPRFTAARRLRQRKHRDAAGRFLIESRDMVAAAHDAGVAIEELWLCPDLGGDPMQWLHMEVPIYTVPADLFATLAYRRHPEGHLAVASTFPTALDGIDLGPARLVLVAAGIEKPGNLGALLRTAHAFGADAVVAAGGGTDLFNPNVIRSSRGALFLLPVAVATENEARAALEFAGLETIPTSTRGARSLWAADLRGPCAVVVGSEARGLDPQWDPSGPHSLRIPVEGPAGSLNVSVAAAVVLAEAHRQRHHS